MTAHTSAVAPGLPAPPATPRELSHAASRFRYWRAGNGPETLLILPGALGGGELVPELARALAGSYRVLLVEYPPVASMDALLAGVVAILEEEGVDRCAVLGGSFGGAVAQCLLRRHPERVSRLILSGTVGPDPARASSNRRFMRLLPYLPMPLLRGLLRGVIRLLLRRSPRRRELGAYYRSQVRQLCREDLESRYRLGIDYDEGWSFDPADLAGWDGEVLILEGSADKVARRISRDRLRSLYPGAACHAFEGVGHGASAIQPEAFREVVTRFLRGGAAAVA